MLFPYHSVYVIHCGSEKKEKSRKTALLSRGKHSRIFASWFFVN